jgi:hypothetical protein
MRRNIKMVLREKYFEINLNKTGCVVMAWIIWFTIWFGETLANMKPRAIQKARNVLTSLPCCLELVGPQVLSL